MSCDCRYHEDVSSDVEVSISLPFDGEECYVTLLANFATAECRHGIGRAVYVKGVVGAEQCETGDELPAEAKQAIFDQIRSLEPEEQLRLIDSSH